MLHLSHPWTWHLPLPGIWFPPAAIGFLLLAWLGPRALGLILVDALLVLLQAWATRSPILEGDGAGGLAAGLWISLVGAGEAWLAWWFYNRLDPEDRRLLDPRAAR